MNAEKVIELAMAHCPTEQDADAEVAKIIVQKLAEAGYAIVRVTAQERATNAPPS